MDARKILLLAGVAVGVYFAWQWYAGHLLQEPWF
jgi:hypothetical protein